VRNVIELNSARSTKVRISFSPFFNGYQFIDESQDQPGLEGDSILLEIKQVNYRQASLASIKTQAF
jgi:hypothetical protein